MKSLGNVVSVSKGKLVVKTSEPLKAGHKIFDESGNFVGNVLEFFGPTEKPYVLVSPKKNADHYLGKELFG